MPDLPERNENTVPETESLRLPPATLQTLVTMLGMQAMSVIGFVSLPGQEKNEPRPDEARHLIDLIEMLVTKTEGNRTPEETKEIDDMLHGLRITYVNVMQQHRQSPPTSEMKD